MPVYTLIVTAADGNQRSTVSDFRDDQAAITDTGLFVSPDHPGVALARGAGDDVEFLGAWDWNAGEAQWTPED